MGKRIGIFGGSFNPIHNGHLQLAKAAVWSGYADEVWLMVSPQNPLKAQSTLLDEKIRMAIAEKAVEDESRIFASDFEFSLPRPSYTWRTLDCLQEKFPSDSFSLIIGADNLANFSKWVRADYILSHYEIIVYPRKGFDIVKPALCKRLVTLDLPVIPWSSTEIRERLLKGESVSEMVPAKALEYIMENHLYQEVVERGYSE